MYFNNFTCIRLCLFYVQYYHLKYLWYKPNLIYAYALKYLWYKPNLIYAYAGGWHYLPLEKDGITITMHLNIQPDLAQNGGNLTCVGVLYCFLKQQGQRPMLSRRVNLIRLRGPLHLGTSSSNPIAMTSNIVSYTKRVN